MTEDRKSKIEFHLTALQKFSGGEFRKHLYPRKFEMGIGLKKSFADKYFLFRRIR